jgi:hypothetical protein
MVILTGDLEIEPFVQLRERELRLVLRLITAPGRRRGIGAAGQEMDPSHHGADKPLDMCPEPGSCDGPVRQGDPILGAAASERLSLEF